MQSIINVSDDGSYIKLNAVGRASNRPIGDYRNLLLQKWPAPEFSCITKMNISGMADGDNAGFIHMGMDYLAADVTVKGGKMEVYAERVCSRLTVTRLILKRLKNCLLHTIILRKYISDTQLKRRN